MINCSIFYALFIVIFYYFIHEPSDVFLFGFLIDLHICAFKWCYLIINVLVSNPDAIFLKFFLPSLDILKFSVFIRFLIDLHIYAFKWCYLIIIVLVSNPDALSLIIFSTFCRYLKVFHNQFISFYS